MIWTTSSDASHMEKLVRRSAPTCLVTNPAAWMPARLHALTPRQLQDFSKYLTGAEDGLVFVDDLIDAPPAVMASLVVDGKLNCKVYSFQ